VKPVLVVDDDADIRTMMTMFLESSGFSVVAAQGGREGLNAARAHHPGLILLDLMMPGVSGEDFRRAQLASPDLRDIPVVVCSAHYDAPQIARRLDARDCLGKPVDLEALESIVRRHCPDCR